MFTATFERGALHTAVTNVLSAVASTDSNPVLSNVHMLIAGSGCRLTATDGVVSLTCTLPVLEFTGEPSMCVLPAKRLVSILHTARDAVTMQVTTKSDKPHARVSSGAQWDFPLMSPKGFPNFAWVIKTPREKIEASSLLTALTHVHTAMSDDSLRPNLRVVNISGGHARASDSVRLQQAPIKFPFDCSIPDRAVRHILKVIPTQAEAGQTEKALVFRLDSTLFSVQKMVAKFPNVKEVLLQPSMANDQEVVVDRKALIEAVRRVHLFADDHTFAVVLSLNKGWVSVQCKDQQGAVAVEHIEADWSYSPRHVAFNHRHLTDFLASSNEQKVSLRLGKDLVTKPSSLLLEDPNGFTGVLSQIRQDWNVG